MFLRFLFFSTSFSYFNNETWPISMSFLFLCMISNQDENRRQRINQDNRRQNIETTRRERKELWIITLIKKHMIFVLPRYFLMLKKEIKNLFRRRIVRLDQIQISMFNLCIHTYAQVITTLWSPSFVVYWLTIKEQEELNISLFFSISRSFSYASFCFLLYLSLNIQLYRTQEQHTQRKRETECGRQRSRTADRPCPSGHHNELQIVKKSMMNERRQTWLPHSHIFLLVLSFFSRHRHLDVISFGHTTKTKTRERGRPLDQWWNLSFIRSSVRLLCSPFYYSG